MTWYMACTAHTLRHVTETINPASMRKKDRIFIIESLQHLQYGDMQEGPMHAIASSIVHAVHFDK